MKRDIIGAEARELTCIGCPMGCRVTASFDGVTVENIAGNGCAIGARYAQEELTRPARMVTALVRVKGSHKPLPVKTTAPIEKRLIPACLAAVRGICAVPPVHAGDVLLKGVCGTETDIVATAEHEG